VTLSLDELRRVVLSLDEIDEGQVRRVRERDFYSVTFEFYVGEGFRRLLIGVRPQEARLHYTDEKGSGAEPGHPSAFVMACRKHLTGARLFRAETDRKDRVVTLEFDRDDGQRLLIFECSGHHPNLFLTDPNRRILARLAESNSHKRDLSVGRRYEKPLTPEKENPLHQVGLVRFLEKGEALHAAIDAHYRGLEAERSFDDDVRAVWRKLQARLRHIEKKRANVAADLGRADEAPLYLRQADALKANLYQLRIPKGAEQCVVELDGEPVEVPLDPRLTLNGNMEALYRKAHKYGETRQFVAERLGRIQAEEDALRADAARLDQAKKARDTAVIRELGEAYHEAEPTDPALAKPRAEARGPAEREPFRAFKASTGATILVGKGARDNEELSLKVANGRDLWFHARDYEGAHVILRVDKGGEPAPAAIDEAALLAAYYSKGGREAALDVSVTEAKHVSRAKGAPAGQVSVASERTVRVRLDPEKLKRFFPDREFDAPKPSPARKARKRIV
jgi:predicted ribosome quality control (RQC) complex YloA/Tae2 family protein